MHAATPLLLITLALAAPLNVASAQQSSQTKQATPTRERKPSNDATPALGDNAALIYYSIWTMENRDDAKVFSELCGLQEFGKALPQALHDALMRNQSMITRLIRATKMKHCDFGRDFSEGFGMLLPELAKMRALARLLVADADRCLVEGKPDDAAERYAAVFGLARHSGQDRVLISSLVSIALANFTADDLVDHKAAAMLTRAGRAKVLAAIDRLNGAEGFGLKRALDGERELAVTGTILKYDGPDAGRRFADEVLGIMTAVADARPNEPQIEKIRQLDGAALRAEARKLDQFYDAAIKVWDSPSANETLKNMSDAASEGEYGLLGTQLLPALSKCRASQDKGGETLRRISAALHQANADEDQDIKEGRTTR